MRHKFVEFIPDHLEQDVVYVSIEFALVVHKCFCGCGNDVVTPLSPVEWSLTFDGESISLFPSIGNWSLPCRSHYWIRKGKVDWSIGLSKEKIELIRTKDRAAKLRFYEEGVLEVDDDENQDSSGSKDAKGLTARIGNYLKK